MYDSYGDGWNGASYTIYAEDGVTELASGELLNLEKSLFIRW